VGSIVSFTGAITGFYFIFCVPVYLHAYYTKPKNDSESLLDQPMNVSMLTQTHRSDIGGSEGWEEESYNGSDDLHSVESESAKNEIGTYASRLRKWKISTAIHSILIAIGAVILIYQFVIAASG
jgi:hypothetical protein